MNITQDNEAHAHVTHANAVLRVMQQIEKEIVHAKDPARLLQHACDLLVKTPGCAYAWIARLPSAAPAQQGGSLIAAVKPALDLSLTALRAVLEGGDVPLCVERALDRQAPDAEVAAFPWSRLDLAGCDIHPQLTGGVIEDVVSLRLQHEAQRYGVLTVGLSAPHDGEANELPLLMTMAADLAYGLYTLEQQAARRAAEARLREQAERAYAFQRRTMTLIRVGNQLAFAESVDELFRLAVELAVERLGFERMGIWLCCEDDPTRMRGTYGIDERGQLRDERGEVRDLEDDLIQWGVLAHPEVIYHEHASLYNERHAEVGLGHWARAMLWIDDHFVGIISVDTLLTGNPITLRDRDLLALYAATLSDLYSRKRAEMALREREALYRTLFDTTGAATMVLDADLTLVLVNDETVSLLGLGREVLQGHRQLVDFVAADEREAMRTYFEQLHDTPDTHPDSRECGIVPAAGDVRDVAIFARPIPGTRRSVVSMLDVTERNRIAARNLRWARQQSALNVLISRATTTTDLESLLVLALEQTLRALDTDLGAGFLQNRVVVRGILRDGVLRDMFESDGVALERDGPLHIREVFDRHADDLAALGIHSPLAVSIGEPEAAYPTGWLMVASRAPRAWTVDEISMLEAAGRQLGNAAERLALLDRVQHEARRLQNVVDTVPQALVLLGIGGEILLTNARADDYLARLAGVGEGEILSRLGEMTLDELLKPPQEQPWHELQEAGRTYEATARPLVDDAGSDLQGWVLVLRDVTEERLAQRQMYQQERLAAVGRLAAGIAHDFNNIIAVIVLYAQLAMRQPGMPQGAQDKLAVVIDQGHRATDLIGQILDFSRHSEMEQQTLDLLPYLKGICDLLQRTLPDNVRIDLTYGVASYLVHADPTGIQQALMNLATNARDAMPEGGEIQIELRSLSFDEPAMAPVETMSPGRWIALDFTDTGAGIPPDVLPYVFEPFFTTKETGVGLGLPQVFGIVKQHKGEVTIASKEGEGTTLSIYLPALAEPEPALDAPLTPDQLVSGAGQTVLVVEDNAQTRKALVLTLETLHYHPLEAQHGRAAMAILDEHRDAVKLILSDAVMPEMGGAELLRALRERGWSYPVVVVSGYLPPEEQQQFNDDPNFVTWLTKPVDIRLLASTIAAALRGA